MGRSKQTNPARSHAARKECGANFHALISDSGGEFFVVYVSLPELDGGQRSRLRVRVGCRNDGGEIRSLSLPGMNIRQTSRASGILDEENREWDSRAEAASISSSMF